VGNGIRKLTSESLPVAQMHDKLYAGLADHHENPCSVLMGMSWDTVPRLVGPATCACDTQWTAKVDRKRAALSSRRWRTSCVTGAWTVAS